MGQDGVNYSADVTAETCHGLITVVLLYCVEFVEWLN